MTPGRYISNLLKLGMVETADIMFPKFDNWIGPGKSWSMKKYD